MSFLFLFSDLLAVSLSSAWNITQSDHKSRDPAPCSSYTDICKGNSIFKKVFTHKQVKQHSTPLTSKEHPLIIWYHFPHSQMLPSWCTAAVKQVLDGATERGSQCLWSPCEPNVTNDWYTSILQHVVGTLHNLTCKMKSLRLPHTAGVTTSVLNSIRCLCPERPVSVGT